MRFADRRHAGEHLGRLVAAAGPEDPVVYGLPRGGVPVGYEVARALGCPFDVVIVRKIGVPSQPELAMGAVAEGGVVVRNDELVAAARISEETFAGVLESERIELDKRVASYRDGTEAVSPIDGTAIVVDDGLALAPLRSPPSRFSRPWGRAPSGWRSRWLRRRPLVI